MTSRNRIGTRLLRRLGVAAMAVIPALTLAAPGANSGPVVGDRSVEPTADIRTYGKKCAGAKVPRCVWLRVDHTNHRVRAYAEIHDVNDGYRYDVDAQGLYFNANPELYGFSSDHDGWQHTADGAWTKLIYCQTGTKYNFTLRTNFWWRNADTGNVDGEYLYSHHGFTC